MPPNPDKQQRIQPSMNFKYPTNRDNKLKTPTSWLEGKKIDDNTGGLWRVHDNLYDVTDFISAHPGGPMWLELTKGSDITEAFEAHHFSSLPEEMLKKYFVRKATTPRNSPFSFKEDGFYKTLKRNVITALKDIPKDTADISSLITDGLCVSTFIVAILACKFSSFLLLIAASFCLTYTVIASHNYFHKKDNFRMYYFNLCMMDYKDWRISHSLSHHLFPNTIYDFEVSAWEPLILYLPHKKSLAEKYGTYLLTVPLWSIIYVSSYIKRMLEIYNKTHSFEVRDTIAFTVPLAMYIFSGAPLLKVIGMWLLIIIIGSLIFGSIGFNAAHHHPEIFHEGDAPRAKTDVDWGIHQLDTVADRHDINRNIFLILTNFGDHALHHLFPTLDHAKLEYLYPTFERTVKEFGVKFHLKSQAEMILGQFQQLSKDEPNPISPGAPGGKPKK